jgi:hypothetical protein
MPLYTTAAILAVPVVRTGQWDYLLAYPAGYAVAYLTLEKMSRPPGPPNIEIPEDLL